MRVGITTDLRYSMFSAGHANACFSIARILQAMNYDVYFIHRQEASDWWDDVDSLKEGAPKRIFLGDFIGAIVEPLDLVVEVAFNMKPDERQKVAKVINPDYLIYGEKNDVGDSH